MMNSIEKQRYLHSEHRLRRWVRDYRKNQSSKSLPRYQLAVSRIAQALFPQLSVRRGK